ncbi:hypothetical protein, partial [Paenibacillus wynnii]|uniref:hypothetical protein n=1 Tax=Paenibacillus wynnii TaxID=268407 RepID=UPI0027D90F21
PAPMVLGPKGPGRVGRCQAHETTVDSFNSGFCVSFLPVEMLWIITEKHRKLTNMWIYHLTDSNRQICGYSKGLSVFYYEKHK